jgi:hypothetical protein
MTDICCVCGARQRSKASQASSSERICCKLHGVIVRGDMPAAIASPRSELQALFFRFTRDAMSLGVQFNPRN